MARVVILCVALSLIAVTIHLCVVATRQNNLDAKLVKAADNNSIDEVRRLIRTGANPTIASNWLVYAAAADENLPLLHALLEGGANGHAVCRQGDSALDCGACSGNVKVMDELIKFGASPADRDARSQMTPLLWASISLRPDSIKWLIDRGADVNARDGAGWCAVMYVFDPNVLNTHQLVMKCLKILLNSRPDLSIINCDGHSALYYAVANRDHEAISLLLANGADPSVAGKGSELPLALAQRLGDDKTVSELSRWSSISAMPARSATTSREVRPY